MKEKGYSKFSMHRHTQLWKKMDGKNPNKNFGVSVEGAWYWYDHWLEIVEEYCLKNKSELE